MTKGRRVFGSIYSHGFLRAAVCIPEVRVADPAFNRQQTLALARQATEQQTALALFPELGLSAYSNDDLFHQDALLDASTQAVEEIVRESDKLTPVLVVGTPLQLEDKLFNCAVVIHRGRVLGVIPKTYLPNYREYYEKRQFNSGDTALARTVSLAGETVPFGSNLVFDAPNYPGFSLHAEICEDLWSPIPPSTWAALSGATVLCNLSGSNITIGKTAYRQLICASQSGKCVAAYLYAGAGFGESTTDVAWDGHGMILENGELLVSSERFRQGPQMITADIDLERLRQERMRLTSLSDTVKRYRDRLQELRHVEFEFAIPQGEIPLQRKVDRFPYVPSESKERDERCFEAYNIQVHGLAKRLTSTGIDKVVIGVSGGLDSTQALIVAVKAMDRLELPRGNVLAYTMPGFATGERTYTNAFQLMRALQVAAQELDIRPSAEQMLQDIGHPFAEGESVHDVTFENVQAGERTSHLFRLANHHGALVLGTGDLSELALGWNTYGVGDQMSHYNVNASVPKTLIQYLIRWAIKTEQFDQGTREILQSIVDTEISPELVPGEGSGQPAQSTEEAIGPYQLQDFNLYYISRYGFRPSRVAFLAHHAWGDRNKGAWPDTLPPEKRNEYDLDTIKRWMEVFLYRFFKISQFKRSALPNAPKVGSGGSLSPRGDWRAPSDAEVEVWLEELRQNVP